MLFKIVTLFLCLSSAFADDLTISTNKGKVRGITINTFVGKEVDAWYGIPFAKKPLGNLRFKAPLSAEAWDGVLETSTLPNACTQSMDTFFGDLEGPKIWIANTPRSEDCLYLNVVVPKPRPQNATVMVWIYGGGFYSGSNSLETYNLTLLAAQENIIMVSMQYRVASLGFLHLGPEASGNVGLLDQALALQWVHDNIAAFGGNADDVTIFGESAGSGSVSYHLVSPVSRNLFKRAIMESGTVFAPWGLLDLKTSIKRGLLLAKQVGCPHDPQKIPEVVDCLQKVNATDLITAEESIPLRGIIDFPFLPVIDGTFFKEDPIQMLKKGDFKKASILLGANSREGFYFLFYALPDLLPIRENVTVTYNQFVNAVKGLRNDKTELEKEAILFHYTNWENLRDGEKNRDALDHVVGDQFFVCNTMEFADVYANSGNNVYLYHYMHNSPKHYWPHWSGALHGDEVLFVFGDWMKPHRMYSEIEKEFGKKIMRYWANFARTGNPSASNDKSVCNWPLYKPNEGAYLNLDIDTCAIGTSGLQPRSCMFWNKYMVNLKQHKEQHKC